MHSLLSDERKCWICGSTRNLERHHVYGGNANRPLSEKYGCWVYLCKYHHTGDIRGNREAVHFNKRIRDFLREECQIAFEKKYGHERFMEVFKKNYK